MIVNQLLISQSVTGNIRIVVKKYHDALEEEAMRRRRGRREKSKTREDACLLVDVRARVHPQKEHTSNWRHEVRQPSSR